MPFAYALVLILTALEALLYRPLLQPPGLLFLISAMLWTLSIIYTILGPVPINNRVASWHLDHLPENWRHDRKQWDQLHRLRVVLLLIAFVLQAWGASHP